jgi:hypothetical protein
MPGRRVFFPPRGGRLSHHECAQPRQSECRADSILRMPDRQTLLGTLWDRQLPKLDVEGDDRTGARVESEPMPSPPPPPPTSPSPTGRIERDVTEVRGESPQPSRPAPAPAPSRPDPNETVPVTKVRGESGGWTHQASAPSGVSVPPEPTPAPDDSETRTRGEGTD